MEQGYEEDSIRSFVKKLLVQRFPDQRLKQEINSEDPQKLNFSCPYCGDSDRDSTKKRGNLYLKTLSYKCFNDGCQIWVPINKFISKFSLKYSIDLPNVQENTKKKIRIEPKRNNLIEFLINPKVKNSLINFSDLKDRFFLKPCKDAPVDSLVWKYIESRKINSLPAFEQTCYYDSNQDKIFIFNLDLRSGKILGFSMRRIFEGPGPKYNIKNYSEFKKTGLVLDIEDEIIQKVDSINNYYNILNVNFNDIVTVTEGQIDAMFIKNSISTTGVTKSKSLLDSILSKKNSRILFDNDKAGKEESIKLIQSGYRVFLWSKLIDDLKKKFSDRIQRISKIKDINDLFIFYSDETEISFDEFNQQLDNYFSDSIYDIYLI
jgi:hypothetical protein